MTYLDLAALERAPLQRDPYDFLILPNFILPDRFKDIVADFPAVPGAGSHPPAELVIEGHFKSLMDELQGPAFRSAIETKFGIDLTGRPTMYTVRGFVSERDGAIHTDSRSKLITVLLYMNEGWEADGGRLRILRSGTSLEKIRMPRSHPTAGRCSSSAARRRPGTAIRSTPARAASSSSTGSRARRWSSANRDATACRPRSSA